MFSYLIQMKNIKNKKIKLEEVKGYKMPYNLFSYKKDNYWILSDAPSGAYLKKFNKFSEIKDYLKDDSFLKKLQEIRKTERYNKLCESLNKKAKNKKSEKKYFIGVDK